MNETNARHPAIRELVDLLVSMGAKEVICGAYQPYELRAKYGAPELKPERPAYRVIILPNDDDGKPDSLSTPD